MKRDFEPNGYPYYKYMLCYVDNLLHIGFNPKEDMDALNIIYRLKGGFGPYNQYLGANTEKLQSENGLVVCPTNCVGCLKCAIYNVNNSIGVDKMTLNNYGYGNRSY